MLSLLLVALAPAASGTVDADLRCVAVTTAALGTATDDTTKQGLTVAAMYFVGRIDAVRPGFDYSKELGDLLTDQARVTALAVDAKRCGALLQERGKVLQAVGARLQERAKAPR